MELEQCNEETLADILGTEARVAFCANPAQLVMYSCKVLLAPTSLRAAQLQSLPVHNRIFLIVQQLRYAVVVKLNICQFQAHTSWLCELKTCKMLIAPASTVMAKS